MDVELIHPADFFRLLKVAIAMALGALIGIEREAAKKPAGLRTHMLVAGAASFLVMLGNKVMIEFGSLVGAEYIGSDPIRIIAAVITGVSFLGAGTIIRLASDHEIEGLTTAASLLIASAVGIGVALSQWVLAVGTTLLVLITLRILPFITTSVFRLGKKDKDKAK